VLAAAALLVASPRSGLELIGLSWFAAVGTVAAFVDLRVRRLPDLLTGAAAAGLLLAFGVAALVEGRTEQLLRAAGAGIVVVAAMAVLAIARPGALGGGDVKFGFAVGAALGWVSWFAVYAGITAAFGLAMIYALAVLATRRGRRRDQFAFGPFLVAGTLLALTVLP
jgi:leader peptidase (prepilin peptidase)/N-methyltransferase